MQSPFLVRLLSLACLVSLGFGGVASAQGKKPAERPAPPPGDKKPKAPEGPRPVFGEVVDVRGTVLQLRGMGKGLSRVVLAPQAQLIRDDVLTLADLKPGMKIGGVGRQVEGTGTPTVPLKVELLALQLGDTGGPFAMFGGGGFGPIQRGRQGEVFQKQNYSGTLSFDAKVKSVSPLVLTDEQGRPLPLVIGESVDVRKRGPHPIKEGDITAGMMMIAMGETMPDGLLKANLLVQLGEGNKGPASVAGTLLGVSDTVIKIRPRFSPDDLDIEVSPTAKVYLQEHLDLDTIQVGDTLSFTGKVITGTAAAPKTLVVNTITATSEEVPPQSEGGGGPFGDRAIIATITGKILSFDPVRLQREDGSEVALKIPGQIAYVRYRRIERSELKASQKAIFTGRSKEGGLIADTIVVIPFLPSGFGG